MEQLLLHLLGDFWLQNDWMAKNKKNDFRVALLHSFVYTIPFLLITRNLLCLALIMITHAIIDGTDIVLKLNQVKNWNFKSYEIPHYIHVTRHILEKTPYLAKDGYEFARPLWIRVWLIIIQDNTLHLIINYLCLKYIGG